MEACRAVAGLLWWCGSDSRARAGEFTGEWGGGRTGGEMRDDLVTPATGRRLQRAGLAWDPQVGDWCMVLGGEHFHETQSGLWLVVSVVRASGQLGVMDAEGKWPVTRLAATDCVWVPTVGKLKMELRARGLRVQTGEFEPVGLGSGVRQACRVLAPGAPSPVAEGQGPSESEAVADALLRLLEATQSAEGSPGWGPWAGRAG